MPSRSTLSILIGASAILGFSACKSFYSDTFAYKKNSFKGPVEKAPEIKLPPAGPQVLEGAAPGGAIPGAGGIPGVPGPDAGGLPGMPGAAPGVPGAAPAAPAVPGAVPGL
ncbi:MAG: hypothetical protein ABI318_21810 [Chthoniobacteraceae bacterium]